MRRTFVKTTFLSIALLGLVGAAQAEWVAFNDYIAGNSTQTSANATTNDLRLAGGPYTLKNITNGSVIPNVTMTVTVTGGDPANGTQGASPNANSPLYNTFNGFCYFYPNNIQVTASQMITVTFSNLNPAKIYKLHAGAIRGTANTDRWTKCNILGVDSVTPNHQQAADSPYGMITANNSSGLLTDYEVAFNSGVNLCGDMVEWDNIYPGADGSFSFTSTQWKYANPVDSHGTTAGTFTPNSANYGYAVAAFRLEEMQAPNSPPTITSQPVSQTNIFGTDVTFTVGVIGNDLKFQWRKNGNPIANATNQSYTVSNLTASSEGTYSLAVTNPFGGTVSSTATLTVIPAWPIVITSQPQSVSTVAGQPVTFDVVVTGSSPQYQWMKGGTPILNATNASYNISSVTPSHEGTYSVRVTNRANSVISGDATLTLMSGAQALFIGRTALSPADKVITNILTSQGFIVLVTDDRNVTSSSVATTLCSNKSLVVLSSSADPNNAKNFSGAGIPVVSYGSDSWFQLLMSISTYGILPGQTSINIVDNAHPLAAGLNGLTQVYQSAQDLDWGIPNGNAIVIAVAANNTGNEMPVLFGYEKNARSSVSTPFSARRVGVFLGNNSANSLSTAGINLFKAAVNWAISPPITNAPVGISRQPVNISIPEGMPAIFSVNATGTPAYGFTWQRNGSTVANGYNRLYTINNPTPADNGAQFRVIVTNRVVVGGNPSYYQATSTVATLTVLPPLPIAITQQPANRLVDLGQNATFSVAITGTAPYYQWYHNNTAIPGANTNTYMVTGIQNSDLGNYYVVITNRAGSVTSSTAQLSLYPAPVTLLGWNTNTWRFYTNYTDLGSGWTTNGYNDSTWPVGSGIFLGGDAAAPSGYTAGTTIPLTNTANTKIVTWYFRNHFNFTNNVDEISLAAESFIDDGAIFYLNGQQVQSDNMPATFAYNTWASSGIQTAIQKHSFSIDPYQLRQGDNTFAVELHQGAAQSGDAMMGVQLTLSYIRPTTLAITNQPRNITIEEGNDATFTVGVSGLGARYQWFKDRTAIPGATRPSYTVTNAPFAAAGDYYVTVSNYLSYITSDTAHLTVTTNTSLPTLVSADGTQDPTLVLVTFSEQLLASTANNKANFTITNLMTRSTLTINGATLTNQNQVLLTTAARGDYANYVLIVNGIRDAGSLSNTIANNSMIPISGMGTPITYLNNWDYYVPYWYENCSTCDNPDMGTAWRSSSYTVDYSIWGNNAGVPGVFYYGNLGELPAPLGMTMQHTYAPTAYFRTPFQFYGNSASAQVRFRFITCAGAVFYINGQEVYRVTMPSGTVAWNTLANGGPGSPFVTISDWTNLPTAGLNALIAGTNLMAVEVHQSVGITGGNSRQGFGMEMQLFYTSLAFGPVLITTQPKSTTVYEGQPVTFTSVAVGSSRYQWYSNAVAIAGATNDTFSIPFATKGMSNTSYYVIASNATNSMTSSNAYLSVAPDPRSPEIVSAAIGTNKTISIVFNRSLDAASATNANNYNFSCGAVVSALLTNGNNVILTTVTQPTTDCTVGIANLTGPGATNAIACGTSVSLTDPTVVTIVDQDPPIISGCSTNITTTSTVVTWAAPTAVDFCSGVAIPVTCYPSSGSTFTNGTTQVSCFAYDTANNTAYCGFTVTVQPAGPIPLKYTADNNLNKITLSWTNNPAGYALQTCTNLGSANLASSATWISYQGPLTTNNNTISTTLTRTNSALFFRLKQVN